jgi:DNA invertase Pin-like site-specific DNA recombinase
MKYVIYQRVSTDLQDVETQQKECLNYIKQKEKEKSFEYNIFEDPEMSSRVKMSNRTGLMEFLKFLTAGYHVVVYKLDRLSRDVVEMVTIYRMIKDKKCTIYSLNDPDCDNEFIIGLMGVLAQKERKDISDRTKAALRNKRSKNERIGTVPYGYTLCPDKLIEIKNKDGDVELKPGLLLFAPSEQEALVQMCQYFDEGKSYRQIAQILTNQGYRNREGNPFQHMSIYRILCRTGRTRSSDQPREAREFQMFHS